MGIIQKERQYKIITDDLEITKSYGITVNGIYNAIVDTNKGIRSRGRSEILIIDGNKVYLSKSKKGLCGDYSIPGGGWDEKEPHNESAMREAEEEARLKTRNVRYAGKYLSYYDEPHSWVLEKIPEEYQWRGYYTEVYIGEYAGKYTGKIDDNDKDDIIKTGKFYNIKDVFKELHPIHQDAITRYISDPSNMASIADKDPFHETYGEVFGIDESYVFSKDDLYINYEKFESGKCNICLVTRLSGSGKSTIAQEIARKNNAEWIELDNFEHCYIFTDDQLKQAGQVFYDYLSLHKDVRKGIKMDTIKGKDLEREISKFLHYCISWCRKDKSKKYVIEGVQIYSFLEFKDIKSYPLIIKNTSMLKSIIQRWKRNGDGKINLAKELKNEFPQMVAWYKDEEKLLSNFRKSIVRESNTSDIAPQGNLLSSEVQNEASEESIVQESLINPTLYHGSIMYYEELKSTGIDLGNALQKPGWSLFCWTKYDYAIGWAIFCILKNLSKIYDGISILCCGRSHIPYITETTYRNLILNLDRIPDNYRTYYIYTIKPRGRQEYGIGHSSNTPNCITIRNCSIKPYKTDRRILTIQDIEDYCEIVPDDYEPTKSDHGADERLLSFLMTSDYVKNIKGKRQLADDVEKGLLNIGDDIEEYIARNDIKINKMSVKEKLRSLGETRSELPNSEFGLPDKRKYPLNDAKHVRSAVKFFNYVDPEDEAELARNIKRKAKEHGVIIRCGKGNRLSKYIDEKYINEFMAAGSIGNCMYAVNNGNIKQHVYQGDHVVSTMNKYPYIKKKKNDTKKDESLHEGEIKKPAKCKKCGSSNIGIFIKGEPIFLCKDCGEYNGTVPCRIHEENDIDIDDSMDDTFFDNIEKHFEDLDMEPIPTDIFNEMK